MKDINKLTREEIIASYKHAIERKKAWEEQAQKDFAAIRRGEKVLSY
jgi:hypothetical protein